MIVSEHRYRRAICAAVHAETKSLLEICGGSADKVLEVASRSGGRGDVGGTGSLPKLSVEIRVVRVVS